MRSVARTTLERARFFTTQAEAAAPLDRIAFGHNLEAAIVFARSVTFHLQKEFAHVAGFDAWYANWQQVLKKEPLACYLNEARRLAVHQGPLTLARTIVAVVTEAVSFYDEAIVTIRRGRPWYRQPLRVVYSDLMHPVRIWLHRRRERDLRRKRQTLGTLGSRSEVLDLFHFADAPWDQAPAVDLLRRHLDLLEEGVAGAEQIGRAHV